MAKSNTLYHRCLYCKEPLFVRGSEMTRLRRKHNITQRALAAQLKITPSYVAFIEQGKRRAHIELSQRFFKLKDKLEGKTVKRSTSKPRDIAA